MTCRCGHTQDAHTHYRPGTDCALCRCTAYVRSRMFHVKHARPVAADDRLLDAIAAGHRPSGRLNNLLAAWRDHARGGPTRPPDPACPAAAPRRSPMSWLTDRLHDWVCPHRDALTSVHADLAEHGKTLARHARAINALETRMTTAENAAYARAAEVVGLIRAEFASLREQVANAATAGAAALEADAQADADRITGLVNELVSVLPATVPDVPVPDPGQPAELPAEPGL